VEVVHLRKEGGDCVRVDWTVCLVDMESRTSDSKDVSTASRVEASSGKMGGPGNDKEGGSNRTRRGGDWR